MSGAANRDVKGVDPITREIAERMARQSGLTLDEWLASLKALDTPDATNSARTDAPDIRSAYLETSRPDEAAPARLEAADHPADEMARMTRAIERLSNRIGVGEERPPATELQRPATSVDEVARMTSAIERLSQRIEEAQAHTGEAIGEVERTVRAAIYRLDGTDRERIAVAARFEGAVQEIGAEQARIAERLERIEKEAHGPRSVEALRALEGALARVAGRLYEGETSMREAMGELGARVDRLQAQEGEAAAIADTVVGQIGARLDESEGRTREALNRLQAAFTALDGRLASVEGEIAGGGVDARLEHLADTLSARLDAARSELDMRLRTMAEGRVDEIERVLAQMSDQMQTSERRSAEALERMGREVSEIAGVLTRRVQESETRGAQAIEQVGGDVARIAQAVETKLGRADTIQAQALERLGGEIARISERLADRIASSDRRAALAIDEVGEQVARTSERFSQRQERVSEELAERIRQSEERTARVLEEARVRLERLTLMRRADADFAPTDLAVEDLDEPLYGEDPFAAFRSPPAAAPDLEVARTLTPQAAETPVDDRVANVAASPAEMIEEFFGAPLALEEPYAVGAGESDAEACVLEAGFGQPDDALLAEMSVAPDAESYRAETEALAPVADAAAAPEPEAESAAAPPPSVKATTWEIVQRTRAAAAAAHGATTSPRAARTTIPSSEEGGLFSQRFPAARSKPPGNGGVVLGVGMAAAVGLAMGGFWYLEGGFRPSALVAGQDAAVANNGASATAMPQEAVALGPITNSTAASGPAHPPAAAEDLSARYAIAVERLGADPKHGLDSLRAVANLGYPPAQFYLAKLYEAGADGLSKDPVEARRWTERAAQGGERKAMHNLALYYFEGTGGPKDITQAGEWFRKAAELGLADSQFNLGRLYEQGLGVPRNAAEAYKWYTVAGRSGDAESRAGAARLAATLTPEERRAAERSALGFHGAASADAGATPATAPSGDMVTAQRALLALGYYQGPADGAPSPALRLALSAYQQDQGLPTSGVPDAATMRKLSVLTR